MRIRVRIDRVLLDGVPIATTEAPYVRTAIESELRRLLVEHGLPRALRASGATPHLRAPDTRVARAHPAVTGTRIGGAVYRSLGKMR
jgi:hypothetical protein